MNPTALQSLQSLPSVPNLPEWIGAGAGVYLFFNGHQVIGAALAAWFGYLAITGKPLTVLIGQQTS